MLLSVIIPNLQCMLFPICTFKNSVLSLSSRKNVLVFLKCCQFLLSSKVRKIYMKEQIQEESELAI